MAENKIVAITVSVDFSDHLKSCVQNNKALDRWIIVTHESDKKTIRVCRDFGLEYIFTERLYDNGALFAKGRAINDGLRFADPSCWILHLDSDILLPGKFSNLVPFGSLSKKYLYGARRQSAKGERINEECPRGYSINEPIGYFQLWHSSFSKTYPEKSVDAADDDSDHWRSFTGWGFLPFDVTDVCGERNVHHQGRGIFSNARRIRG